MLSQEDAGELKGSLANVVQSSQTIYYKFWRIIGSVEIEKNPKNNIL